MCRCVDSLLVGGEDVEIIIVDDGSVDDTGKIADEYARKYPSIVRVIHQENGGHGAGLNAGLNHATGLYFKVVDSDDWIDEESYHQILDTLHNLCSAGCMLDMMISNFVYEKEGARHKSATRYHNILPQGQLFGWEETRNFKIGKYILMHSVIYRTQLLRDCHLVLPKHTFYVDNLFVYVPLPYVKTMYYLDVDFYRYYIGRDDQSVNEKVMISRLDQQIFVTKTMIDMYQLKNVKCKKLRNYMISYLAIMMTVSSILCIRSKKAENLEKKKELWIYLKQKDFKTFMKIRYGILGQTMNIPGRSGRKISSLAYSVARRIIGFN